MERKSKGTMAYRMKPSTFKNKIKKNNFDVDDVIAEEKEANESRTVKEPKNKFLAGVEATVRNFNKKPKR
tara:strand:+ start:490 stop:699 length:210 start_codon:yes stop_codon:yes gene_type:complete